MKRSERFAWILGRFESGAWLTADVLAATPTEEYTAAIGHRQSSLTSIPQFGRDLSAMFTAGILARRRVGMCGSGCRSDGYPSWVYVYEMPRRARATNPAPTPTEFP